MAGVYPVNDDKITREQFFRDAPAGSPGSRSKR
jgi:hypothetical protein